VSTGLQTPSLPTAAPDSMSQRLLQGVAELIRSIQRSGVFLERFDTGKVLRGPAADGGAIGLNWGGMNRVVLSANATFLLPKMRQRNIGQLLMLCKLSATGTLTVKPSGNALNSTLTPTIDGGASRSVSAAGLYLFSNDGTGWFSAGYP
jgi:hypothetical protein